MQKHLFRYAWIFAALAAAILVCLALIIWMLASHAPRTAILSGAEFVKGALFHAAI